MVAPTTKYGKKPEHLEQTRAHSSFYRLDSRDQLTILAWCSAAILCGRAPFSTQVDERASPVCGESGWRELKEGATLWTMNLPQSMVSHTCNLPK